MPTNEYLLGPAIAMGAIGVLSLVLRWIYSDGAGNRRRTSQRGPAAGPADYGLLVPVATITDRAAATSLQGLLRQHGIRATLTPSAEGVAVLVFRADEGRARALLTPSG
ncbi:MAG: hypothetical protein ABJC62_14760 [Frankiaceae bacterium]